MLWLWSHCFNLRSYLSSYHFSQWIISFKQSIKTYAPLQPNQELLLSLLHRYQSRNQSMQIHCQLITSGVHCDRIDKMGMLIWNTVLRQYSQGNFPEEALQLYRQLQETCSTSIPADSFTHSFLIKACANLVDPIKGIQIHGQTIKVGFEFHVYVQTALINMYSECRFLSEARRVFNNMHQRNSVTWNVMITGLTKWGEVNLAGQLFERMPHRTVISWTGMIDGCTRINQPTEALFLLRQMMTEGTKPTAITILSIVPAISNLGNLEIGKCLHAYVEKNWFSTVDIRVSNSLIDMYGKCGSVQDAFRAFDVLAERRNVVSYTSIISALASHGMAREAIDQFEEMKAANLRPNQVTFLSVLNACSHGGLVTVGLKFFTSMIEEYGITPGIKHVGCMIDMLGRAGMLDEAEKMTMGIPMKDKVIVWRTLLAACNFHGNVEMGERVMNSILELEEGYGGDYVLLSNIFAGDCRFDDAEMVRRCMDERNVFKIPGLSLIDGRDTI